MSDLPQQHSSTQQAPRPSGRPFLTILTGNPNCGKTTLFNALTGLRAKVGNYAGVTVERKEGRLQGNKTGSPVTVLDLPGTYSLSPQSLDEQIARDVLFERLPDVGRPDLIVVVVDASNLERNLYYATQVIELGYPTAIALNMMDVAQDNGHSVDVPALAAALDVPIFPMVASAREGVVALREAILTRPWTLDKKDGPPRFHNLAVPFAREVAAMEELLIETFPERRRRASAEALLLLSDEKNLKSSLAHYSPAIEQAATAARVRIEGAGVDWRTAPIEARYESVSRIRARTVTESGIREGTFSDRLDRILTHKVWGMVFFMVIMGLMFQSIFVFAKLPMHGLEAGVGWLGERVAALMPAGDLRSLLVDGVIAGVGAVVVFLPQICLLFLFIGLLEDTGYMARAAFLMDRLMSKVGLHGKSFIPMLSSFACAIPGILATRTIESPKDRLVTILVAPLMSCSARLPVYTLLIAACIPEQRVLGIFRLTGLTMMAMYLLGIGVALAMAWVFKHTLLKGEIPLLIMELPPYKRPVATVIMRHMWDRSRLFLRNAGTVILGINILLWFLASYPRNAELEKGYARQRLELATSDVAPGTQEKLTDAARKTLLSDLEKSAAGDRLRGSFAGRLGRLIEPVIAPLGFDWKIGIGIISSFAAREVFVSTMSVVYNVGAGEDSDQTVSTLAETLRQQKRPDGHILYTTLTGITLMVFYVLALQCASTVAVVRRETNGWKWPVFQWIYLGALAWTLAFVTYHGGRMLGFE